MSVPCQYLSWGMPGRRVGSPIAVFARVQYPLPKQGMKRFNYIVKTIHSSYFTVIYLCLFVGIPILCKLATGDNPPESTSSLECALLYLGAPRVHRSPRVMRLIQPKTVLEINKVWWKSNFNLKKWSSYFRLIARNSKRTWIFVKIRKHYRPSFKWQTYYIYCDLL